MAQHPEEFIDPDENTELMGDEDAGGETEPDPGAETETDPEAPDPDDDKPVTGRQLREMRRELAATQAKSTEHENNARYWFEQSKSKQNTPTAAAAEPEFDGDIVETISGNDPKALVAMLDRLGFARKEDVRATVGQSQSQIIAQQRLERDYPEITDDQSQFFKTTANHFNDMVREDPGAKNNPATLRNAAKMAKLELVGKETPADRNRRVGAQSGGGSTPRPSDRPGSTQLSAVQKNIVDRLTAAGFPVTEEAYRKRAERGVEMGGRPSTRRRAA